MSPNNVITAELLERVQALKKRAEGNLQQNNSIAAKLKSLFLCKVTK